MKKGKIVLTMLLIYIGINVSAKDDLKVKSKIKHVTVFLQGAEIEREASFKYQKGMTKVVFEGMTQDFNRESIQVNGKGEFTIVDISTNVYYPSPEVVEAQEIPKSITKSIKVLSDSIFTADWKFKKIQKNIEAYNEELQMLRTSGVMKGQIKSDSIAALKDAMVYMREMMSEINGLLLNEQYKLSVSQLEINRMNNRLITLRNYKTVTVPPKIYAPIQQIIITISANKASSGKLTLNYMVYDARWSAAYDLRATDINSPMTLVYKANVFQNTGNDWDNVSVTLSTINPNENNQKPELYKWNLNYFVARQPIPMYNNERLEKSSNLGAPVLTENVSESYTFKDDMDLKDAVFTSSVINETATLVEFELDTKYSIPSDGQKHLLMVSVNEVKSKYQYYVVPKVDTKAYLIVKLSNWESLNLLPATANIYYDGTYIGKTGINPNFMSDTLSLALGTDRNIIVKRNKINDEIDEKAFTNNVEKTMEFEITVKNNKSFPISIQIEDQIPVSVNDDIKVNLIAKNNADFDKKQGTLKWNITLGSYNKTKEKFKYSITYDKNQQLTLR